MQGKLRRKVTFNMPLLTLCIFAFMFYLVAVEIGCCVQLHRVCTAPLHSER